MAPPSSVSSAWRVAQHCKTEYQRRTGFLLPDALANDIEAMAEYFFARDELLSVFIRQLIDWSEFVSRPANLGHVAVADLLGARLVDLVVSTNVDTLIEQAAKKLGEPDFYPLVFESELNLNQSEHAPLLKLHGCADRSRYDTVWCKSQLERAPLKRRIEQLAAWLRGHLPNRDLLVVGFWTDWAYLNAILEAAVVSIEPRSIIVVDPCRKKDLKTKSPELAKWAEKNARFHHVRASGDEFLDELRHLLSCHFLASVLEKGRAHYAQMLGGDPPDLPPVDLAAMTTDQLYAIRRDLTGVPNTGVVRRNAVEDSHALIGFLQLGLLLCGARLSSDGIDWNGDSIRLIHSPGEPLSRVRNRFSSEPPNPTPPSRTICAGAWDDGGAPATIIGRGVPHGIIRTASTDTWESHVELLAEVKGGLTK